ncbi:MAG: hypothetical protein IMZ60_02750 [Actinobacteria bacterium]|nr:hypothetical protein [Actinomycetota bacterium]
MSAIKSADAILVKIGELSKQKYKQKVIQAIMPVYQQRLKIIQKQIQNIVIFPTIIPRVIPRPPITPPKKPIEEFPILFKLPEGMSNLIRVNKGYGGYVVAGRIPGRVRQLNRLPLTLESSLSIGTYFALNTPKGYSILKKSPQKVTKQTLERYPNISRDFFRKNKNKIAIIKKGNSLIIKRK